MDDGKLFRYKHNSKSWNNKNEIKLKTMETFEDFLRLHCNIEYDKEGNEVVNSSLSAVMIAFDEWRSDVGFKDYVYDLIYELKEKDDNK